MNASSTGIELTTKYFFLSFLNKRDDVVVALKVENAGARLMPIPKHVGRNCVQTHRFGRAETLAPVLVWNSGIMHFA